MIRVVRLSLGLCLAAALLPAAAHACSLSTFPIFGGVPALVGAATADTLPAGPGGMRYEVDARRPGGPAPRFYGQVVRVERLGRTAAAALPAGTDRVVLVPWDLSADCKTLAWRGSARWAEPDRRGLFHGSLRDSAHWVAGLPTFDVGQPWTQPYPDDIIVQHQRGPLLTVDQAFDLLEALPTYEEHETGDRVVWARLREWLREHPGLACHYPATNVLLSLEDIAGFPPVACAGDGSAGQDGGTTAAADGVTVHPLARAPAGGGEDSSGWGHRARLTRRE